MGLEIRLILMLATQAIFKLMHNGNVHLVTGLTDSTTLANAIVEIYETAPNVWAGKVITAAHDKSKYGYEANTPGLGQTGPSIMIASNQDT